MRTHTSEFKEAIKTFGRELDSKITYTIGGVNYELGGEELNSVTPHFESEILKSAMRGLDIDSNVEIPLETIINFRFGVKVNDAYEYLDFGNYIVYSVEKQEDLNSYKIVCYDNMLKSMIDYIAIGVTYPISVRDYLNAICSYLGIGFKNVADTFPNYDKEIPNELYLDNTGASLGYKFRDVLDELAQVTASIICIDQQTGFLEVRRIDKDNREQKTATGVEISIDDAYATQIKEITINKKSTQKTTTGKQIFDYSTVPGNINLTNNNGLFVANISATRFTIGFTNYRDAIPCNFKSGDKIAVQLKVRDKSIVNKIKTLSISTRIGNSSHTYNKTFSGTTGNLTDQFQPFFNVFNLTDNAETYSISITTNDETSGIEIKDVQVEFNEVTNYEEYTGGLPSPSINYPQPIEVVTGSISLNVNNVDYLISLNNYEMVGFGNYLDNLIINGSGNVVLNKVIGKIASYNGELIETNYISTTGGLDTGATVYYVKPTPEIINLSQDVDINLLNGSNTITSNIGANLTLKYAIQNVLTDTIDEEFLKDVNVNFGEKFGAVNTIVLSRSAGSDNIYYPVNLPENPVEIRISGNQIMNFDNRADYLPDIYDELNGLEYYVNDYSSTGVCYYDIGDRYNVQIGENIYPCIMFNDEINITQGLEEIIHVDMPENTNTNYSKADTDDRRLNRTILEVDKQRGEIMALTSRTDTIEERTGDMYTREQVNSLVQNAQTGLTNTFSTSGGNNIFRNTSLFATEENDENNPYEFWKGIAKKVKEENASSMTAILLQNSTFEQEQIVPNGSYTISFKYKKLIQLATCSLLINDIEYVLNETNETEFVKTIEVKSQHINIKFVSNTNDTCEIYDLMINSGTVNLAYTQNQNETTTDTVNISKGITITSSELETVFKANADGTRVLDKNGNEITKFTDTGITTKKIEAENDSMITGLLFQKVGNHTWITKI